MYKFIFKERISKFCSSNEYIFICSLNNEIPYKLMISISDTLLGNDYFLNVSFENIDINSKSYSKFAYFVESLFYLNKRFDFVFKPNEAEPQEINDFLNDENVRRELSKSLTNILIKAFGV